MIFTIHYMIYVTIRIRFTVVRSFACAPADVPEWLSISTCINGIATVTVETSFWCDVSPLVSALVWGGYKIVHRLDFDQYI